MEHRGILISIVSVLCSDAQSCPTLCDLMDCSLPGPSVHRISQARILEWVTIFFSGDLPNPEIECMSPALAGAFFTTEPPGKPIKVDGFFMCVCMHRLSLQSISRSVLSDSVTPWSVHGILQARLLEWVAICFSWGSSRPKDQTGVSCIAGRFYII